MEEFFLPLLSLVMKTGLADFFGWFKDVKNHLSSPSVFTLTSANQPSLWKHTETDRLGQAALTSTLTCPRAP